MRSIKSFPKDLFVQRHRRSMRFSRTSLPAIFAAALLFAMHPVPLTHAQQNSGGTTTQRPYIMLDPAHGGADTGAHITDSIAEKEITLELTARLRPLLASRFNVITTRDADVANGLSTDQRAEIMGRHHAVACIVVHATGSGNGVHLYTSALPPSSGARHGLLPWDTAQSWYVQQSTRLMAELNTALTRASFGVTTGQTALRPLDNLACPAVAIEIAPFTPAKGGDTLAVTDGSYQQRVAEAVATAMLFWRGHDESDTDQRRTP